MPNQDQLQTVVIAFEQWRNNRLHASIKIPSALRQQAIALIPDYPISKIVKALRLSHSQLKQWSGNRPTKDKLPNFITLPSSAQTTDSDQLNLELSFHNGAQLRLSGKLSPNLVGLLVQTWAASGKGS